MNIAFSPPYIDDDVIEEVISSLKSGWITSGPKVKQLEALAAEFCGVESAICVNSWTSGAALAFKWLGIGPGDEVIVPAYTYAATILAVLHAGAKPVLVDILDDFTLNPEKVKAAISPATKAIMPVDIGGWPADYNALRAIVNSDETKGIFNPATDIQKQLGRPAIIADCAHSFGASYNGKSVALAPDIAIFSLNAVKNITSGEGGIISLNLPTDFNTQDVYQWMKLNSLNGQTKDAFSKSQSGQWKYDIVSMGFKANMPDVCAAIGLAQMRKYKEDLMPARERVVQHYLDFFSKKLWVVLPPVEDEHRSTSFHLFQLRIKGLSEEQRDEMIQILARAGVSSNVHFIPIPMLTYFKELGYRIEDYPNAYNNYKNEISLPLYPQLTNEQCSYIEEQLELAYKEVTQ